MTSSEVYLEYKDFISNVAKRVKGNTKIRSLDVLDLSQEGALFLLVLWERGGLPEEERIMLFTSSLEGHLRNIVKSRYIRDNRCSYVSPLFHIEKGISSILDRSCMDNPVDNVEVLELTARLWKALDETGKVFLNELLALKTDRRPLSCMPVYWWTGIRKRMGLTRKQMTRRRASFLKTVSEVLDRDKVGVGG